ncbi:MAG: hypothetical protein WB493_12005 [Anaeromyxobacteraceae bacterium]
MRKLVLLAAAAIIALGVIAIGAVLLSTDGIGPGPASQSPTAPSAQPVAPALPDLPSGATGATGSPGYPPGPRRVQLPPGRVKVALSEPLAGCFRSYPMRGSLPAVLTLDLEAQASGGFAVLDVAVKTWGSATKGLVECAQRTLRGQVVQGGSFTPGDRATTEFALEPPASIAPPPPEPPPTGLPENRQSQPPRRSGASR